MRLLCFLSDHITCTETLVSSADAWEGWATTHRGAKEVISHGVTEQVRRESRAIQELDGSIIYLWRHGTWLKRQMCLLGSCSQLVNTPHYICSFPDFLSNFSIHFLWDCIPPMKHYHVSFGFRHWLLESPGEIIHPCHFPPASPLNNHNRVSK